MNVTTAKLAEIAAKASSLSERCRERSPRRESETEQQFIAERLTRWCQVTAEGNWEKWHKRLQWDGLDSEDVKHRLVAPKGNNLITSLPPWTETLSRVILNIAQFDPDTAAELNIPLPRKTEHPLPFAEFWLPAIIVGRQNLANHLAIPHLSSEEFPFTLLTVTAYQSLERILWERLTFLSARTLYEEFSQFRPCAYNGFNLLLEQLNLLETLAATPKSQQYYHAFLNALRQDGGLALFENYPVLGRLVAMTIEFWAEATAELLVRLQSDRRELEQVLGSSLGQVSYLKSSRSDLHNRGRCVWILSFDSGQTLVYKPKNLGLEVAYNQFLHWCNQHDAPLPFKVLKSWDRGAYGWVLDYVKPLPCADPDAAQRFYQRAGMLLCVLYLLGGNDCHYENLIAHGEHPLLVDVETLMHPQAQAIAGSPQALLETRDSRLFWDSVQRTGLLPRWEFSSDRRIAYDLSGLGSVSAQPFPGKRPRWQFVNTDEMYLTKQNERLPQQNNVPVCNGVALSPNDYLEEIVAGFEQMYRFFCAKRQALQDAQELQTQLRSQSVRFIFRATQLYETLLEKTFAPEYLRDGADRSIELDILAQTFLNAADKPPAWELLSAELAAMEQMDIPYFGTLSSSDVLTVGVAQPLSGYLKQSSYSQFCHRLHHLNQQDLAWQVAVIRGSFSARIAQTEVRRSPNPVFSSIATDSELLPLAATDLIASAQTLAEEIQVRALRDELGTVSWMGLSYVATAEQFQFQPLGDSLYDGRCGIALFLAALERVSGKSYQNLISATLAPLHQRLYSRDRAMTEQWLQQIGIGGATGLGSIIYTFVKLSQFLEADFWLEAAARAACFLTPERIKRDRQLDIIGGCAGAILGLLALSNQTGDAAVLEKAILCGKHLGEKQISQDNQPKAWRTIADIPLTGFSHGAAGIAYALLRLYAKTGISAYLAAAREGIAYETHLFTPSAQNWPDLRIVTKPPHFAVRWCHGATGIGLGRLGGLAIEASEAIYQDIEVSLQTTLNYGLRGVDHLCCGNFGRLELLLVAGQKLSRPELVETALLQANNRIWRSRHTGGYQLFGNLPQTTFNPGFFQGTAGIGYELLRLAYPEILPSVLLWE
ncbi:MAG: type 2 lanthipeptide synthetase LanM family protein [Oscillatoria sp. PMC 1051.18]|nr:type 2 lanthipeptide synthetase LanM family protein [Oscillatoria sp. PMC 1050.18]MEC5033192.1 type 2 lanthipeptide synthetase LanM family protein [Oscillatoria sp. PMC 1051.18]